MPSQVEKKQVPHNTYPGLQKPRLNWPILAKEWLTGLRRDPAQFFQTRQRRSCPCCEFQGYFMTARKRGPADFRCPNCSSRPRDRQIALWLKDNDIDFAGQKILHFAPEWPLFRLLSEEPGYVGGDILKRRNANAIVNMTNIDFPANHFDILICNHVLEHIIDDHKAMSEAWRVLRSGGLGIFSVPMSREPGTWEPPIGMSVEEVEKKCGWDHKRLYGQDFGKKLEAAGFKVTPFVASPELQLRHALFAETIFFAEK